MYVVIPQTGFADDIHSDFLETQLDFLSYNLKPMTVPELEHPNP